MKLLLMFSLIMLTGGCASLKRSNPSPEFVDSYCAIGSLPFGEHKMQLLGVKEGAYRLKSQDGTVWYLPMNNCLLKESKE